MVPVITPVFASWLSMFPICIPLPGQLPWILHQVPRSSWSTFPALVLSPGWHEKALPSQLRHPHQALLSHSLWLPHSCNATRFISSPSRHPSPHSTRSWCCKGLKFSRSLWDLDTFCWTFVQEGKQPSTPERLTAASGTLLQTCTGSLILSWVVSMVDQSPGATRGGLDWILGSIASLKALSSTGTGCPGKWLSHNCWSCLKDL